MMWIDLQTANAKADECGVDSFDYTVKSIFLVFLKVRLDYFDLRYCEPKISSADLNLRNNGLFQEVETGKLLLRNIILKIREGCLKIS